MYLTFSKKIIIVEVDNSFALIDKEDGLIHILDNQNLLLYRNGEEFECHTTAMVVAATSATWATSPTWAPGNGKPPWAGNQGGPNNRGNGIGHRAH